jgi:hypothetical protein
MIVRSRLQDNDLDMPIATRKTIAELAKAWGKTSIFEEVTLALVWLFLAISVAGFDRR